MLTDLEIRALKPRRHVRKVSDGGGLYLLVTPKGGRCWRYAYRFARKYKTLSLGCIPMFLLSGPGHGTSLLAIYSPMGSILRR
jgi:hypothetical protein